MCCFMTRQLKYANFKFGFQTVTNVKQVSFITMSMQFNWGKQILMC